MTNMLRAFDFAFFKTKVHTRMSGKCKVNLEAMTGLNTTGANFL